MVEGSEKAISTNEGWDPDEGEVFESFEHVQLDPESEIQTENRDETKMESKSPERKLDVAEIEADTKPQDKEKTQRS